MKICAIALLSLGQIINDITPGVAVDLLFLSRDKLAIASD